MTAKEMKKRGIPFWPDNDGGLWYYSEEGITETVLEEDEEIRDQKIA